MFALFVWPGDQQGVRQMCWCAAGQEGDRREHSELSALHCGSPGNHTGTQGDATKVRQEGDRVFSWKVLIGINIMLGNKYSTPAGYAVLWSGRAAAVRRPGRLRDRRLLD